jgi:predicted nucleotidyltransferase
MISRDTIQAAIRLLAEHPTVQRVILFGSYAAGVAREDSDLDFLVIESGLKSRRAEMVRLRASLRPLGVPVDVMVADAVQFEAWKDQPGTALFEAAQHGLVVYERAG